MGETAMPSGAKVEGETWRPARARGTLTAVSIQGVSAEHTSVPRWPTEPPSVDPMGRAYLVISRGEAARAVAAEWAREIRAIGRPLWCDHRDAGSAPATALLRRQIGTARVGLRLMVAGGEIEVLDVLRIARAAGAIEAEWRAHVTAVPARRVQCIHCHQHTIGAVAIGDTICCGGCARSLVVYHHVSRAHGAYMGYMVDAEEPRA
jgi:hypothetical protein